MPKRHGWQHLLYQIPGIPLVQAGASHGVFREARRPAMERQMFLVSADGEVFGSDILNLAVVAGALGLLLATLWTAASPDLPVAQGPSTQQVVVVAHPGHIS
jgi:hypothetical protein